MDLRVVHPKPTLYADFIPHPLESPGVQTAKAIPLLNRELSRLDYNRRVLAKAEDPDVPLLERLRFLAFCSRNLDELAVRG